MLSRVHSYTDSKSVHIGRSELYECKEWSESYRIIGPITVTRRDLLLCRIHSPNILTNIRLGKTYENVGLPNINCMA